MSPGEHRATVDVHRAAHPLVGLRQPVAFDEKLNARLLAHSRLSIAFRASLAMLLMLTGPGVSY